MNIDESIAHPLVTQSLVIKELLVSLQYQEALTKWKELSEKLEQYFQILKEQRETFLISLEKSNIRSGLKLILETTKNRKSIEETRLMNETRNQWMQQVSEPNPFVMVSDSDNPASKIQTHHQGIKLEELQSQFKGTVRTLQVMEKEINTLLLSRERELQTQNIRYKIAYQMLRLFTSRSM